MKNNVLPVLEVEFVKLLQLLTFEILEKKKDDLKIVVLFPLLLLCSLSIFVLLYLVRHLESVCPIL